MKKILLFILLLGLIPGSTFSQTLQDYVKEIRGDTLVIKDDYDYGAPNTLYLASEADNSAPTGRVYMLRSGGYYSLKDRNTASHNGNLRIVGEDSRSVKTNQSTSAPPILCGAVWEGGYSTGGLQSEGNLEVKNCAIELGNSIGSIGWAWFASTINSRITVDNCIMEHTYWTLFNVAQNSKIIIKNSYFVNLDGHTSHRNGGVFDCFADQDTLLVENCTHVNAQGFVYQLRDYKVNRVIFNHNTFINCPGYVFMNLGAQGNISVTNNVFINCNIEGYSSSLRVADNGQIDPEDSPMGFINVNPSNAKFVSLGKRFYVDRNLIYWDPAFDDHVSSLNANKINDSEDWVSNMITMNSRTQAAFDNNSLYPRLTEGTWFKGLPNFTNTQNLFTDRIEVIKEYAYFAVDVNSSVVLSSWRLVNDETDKFTYCDWPIPIDLSYDDEDLMTAGLNGFPVGDLNWFPSQNADWLGEKDREYTRIYHVMEEGDISYLGSRQTLRVLSPNGGEFIRSTQNKIIQWSYNNVDSVKLEYSADNGITWNTIISSIPAASESYSWTLPGFNSIKYKVKLSDIQNKFLNDESDSVFTLYKELQLDSPAGGEVWEVNSFQTISWTKETPGNIGIDLSIDNGVSWTPIVVSISADGGEYIFRVPNTPSEACKIKIYDPAHEDVIDESKTTFTIFRKELRLTSLNGGENLIAGRTYDITWESEYIEKVKIEFTSDSSKTWTILTDSTYAIDQKFPMQVPDEKSTNCKIRITDTKDSTVTTESEEMFSIVIPAISVICPNGGEILTGDEIEEIQWTADLVENVRIEYSTDDGIVWTNIVTSIAASSQSYFWKIPDLNSSECKIRIRDADYLLATDQSDTLFTIEHAVGIEDCEIPTKYVLLQNYPNPFNPTTTISYELPEESFVSIRVFDAMGEEVAVLVSSEKSAGRYKIRFDGSKLSSGIYYYQMKTGDFVQTKKFILLK